MAQPQVHVRFFHADCKECEKARMLLEGICSQYPGRVVVHEYDFMVPSNYLLMVELETAQNLRSQQPVAVYVGSNAVYGVREIESDVPGLIEAGLATGVPLWYPASTNSDSRTTGGQRSGATVSSDDAVESRFKSFTPLAVAGAGLIDGVNPCAFATLVLFVSLLSVYSTSKRDIIWTGLVFALAIFVTYFLLGFVLHGALTWIRSMPLLAAGINVALIGVCALCALLSARDAWKVWQAGTQGDTALKLPPSWRDTISRLLSKYAGRRRWLLGVFGVGIAVSLIESICTGQVYVPTLNYIVRSGTQRASALLLLALYNVMFIVPLLLLTVLVAQGVNSRRLLAWQNSHAVSVRLGMAGLFAALAVLLVIT